MKIQNSFVFKIASQEDMNKFVESLNIQTDKVVIKPNWVDASEGTHTDAKVLDMFLTALKRPAVIIESYTFWRTDKILKGEGDYFSSKEGTLETSVKHWDFFKSQDKWFLEYTGIQGVLAKHGVEYINVTNENWLKQTVSPQVIQEEVEKRYGSIFSTDLYGVVPEKIWDLRDCTLISFAKTKLDIPYGCSLAIKNIFGLIPDPVRYEKYHGGDSENLLVSSIVDTHKIYQSIFGNRKFISEGVFNNCLKNWNNNTQQIFRDWGVIVGGDDALEVDSLTACLIGQLPMGPLTNLFVEYEKIFGGKMIDPSIEIPQDLTLRR